MATDDDIVTRHLREARAELLRDRVRIDAGIQEVDRLIAARTAKARTGAAALMAGSATMRVGGGSVGVGGISSGSRVATIGGDRVVRATGVGGADRVFVVPQCSLDPRGEEILEHFIAKEQPTVRDAIMTVLKSGDRDFQVGEIVDGVKSMGIGAKDDSIKSITSRLVREGFAVKGSSGRSSYRATRILIEGEVEEAYLAFVDEANREPVEDPNWEPDATYLQALAEARAEDEDEPVSPM